MFLKIGVVFKKIKTKTDVAFYIWAISITSRRFWFGQFFALMCLDVTPPTFWISRSSNTASADPRGQCINRRKVFYGYCCRCRLNSRSRETIPLAPSGPRRLLTLSRCWHINYWLLLINQLSVLKMPAYSVKLQLRSDPIREMSK